RVALERAYRVMGDQAGASSAHALLVDGRHRVSPRMLGDLTATWRRRTTSRVRRDGSIDHAHAFQREAVAQVVDQLSLEWLGKQHSCVAEEERGLPRELLGQRPRAREEIGAREQLVDQAQLQRLWRVEDLPGQHAVAAANP